MEPWPDEIATDAVLRVGTRVLLVDEEERLLLLRYVDRGRYLWVPVGGGVEPGETIEQTARREIIEETGFLPPRELIEIGRRRLVVPMFEQLTDAREHWFLARVRMRTSLAPGGPLSSTRRSPPTVGGPSHSFLRPRNDSFLEISPTFSRSCFFMGRLRRRWNSDAEIALESQPR